MTMTEYEIWRSNTVTEDLEPCGCNPNESKFPTKVGLWLLDDHNSDTALIFFASLSYLYVLDFKNRFKMCGW